MLDKLNFKKLALLSVFTAIFSFNAKAEMSPELVNSIKKLDVEAVKANLSSNLSNNNSIKLEDKKQIEELLFKAEKDLKIKWAKEWLCGAGLTLATLIPAIKIYRIYSFKKDLEKFTKDMVVTEIAGKKSAKVEFTEYYDNDELLQAIFDEKIACMRDFIHRFDVYDEVSFIFYVSASTRISGRCYISYTTPQSVTSKSALFLEAVLAVSLGCLAYLNKDISKHIKNIFTYHKEDFDKIKQIRELVNKLEINEGL